MKYVKELDGVRAVAVLLVIVWHWVPQRLFAFSYNIGGLGVDIFFVLSGFLITQILLSNRDHAIINLHNKGMFLKNFYARRILRILPIYILTVAFTVLLSYRFPMNLDQAELVAAATFTTNFYVAHTEHWNFFTVHFWSVAVEEQFYLIWALLLTLIPTRALLPTILLFALIGVASQLFYGDSPFDGYVLPQSCFHALGAGGLLAWFVQERPRQMQKAYSIVKYMGALGALLIVLQASGLIDIGPGRPANVLIAAWLILHLLRQKKGNVSFVKTVLGNKMLVLIGKLSYGMYLYHILYNFLGIKLWNRFAGVLPDSIHIYRHWLYIIVMLPAFIWLCWCSWKYIERPILRQKRFYPYRVNNVRLTPGIQHL